MITLKQESVLLGELRSLTELEFSALFSEMATHINSNGWSHIIKMHYPDYENEFENMQEDRDDWRSRAKTAEQTIQYIKDLL